MKERVLKYLRNLAIESVTIYSYLIRRDAKPSAFVYIPLVLIMLYLALTDLFKYLWNKVMESPDDI